MKLLSASLLLLCFSCNRGNDLHIKVTDSDDTYEYAARFEPAKSVAVQRFVNRHIAPTRIISDGDMEVTVVLEDKTKFDYEVFPGELNISLDKSQNSPAGYARIKKMCEDLNRIINPKKEE
ncbi:hypothetical protein [Dyadobacter aurulentus]|uniref:hypothetical protein n=1 Tax=Dyadobacter sp. UC 10 TaxID=2605428 RepID=UPI0011F0A321|nr:hypothetical protein [Dyadobacter sp. UC 10]KAA0993663.1 hypothetical protein FXO21_27545 [Dyadobacter sp. UC 10]